MSSPSSDNTISFSIRFKPAWLAGGLVLLLGITLGVVTDRVFSQRKASARLVLSDSEHALRPGPWGDVTVTPFSIAAPDEILPIRSLEENGTHWFFKRYSRDQLEKFFSDERMPDTVLASLLDPTVQHEMENGIEVTPPASAVLELPELARRHIYKVLASFPENSGEVNFIHKATLNDRFAGGGVSEETMMLFRQLCCEHDDYLVFGGLSALLQKIPSYDEKLHFVKALTRQKTMTLRLRLQPDTDIEAVAKYWGRGSSATDVRTILESAAKSTAGVSLDILSVLPPLPSSQLFFYPHPQNPLNGPVSVRDCHWTTFNFFRETPIADVNEEFVLNQLKTNYAPAAGDPRYGDVVMLARPDGDVIHSCVYLADEIVFTKNGDKPIFPWMLCTIPDLLKQYSFQVPDGQKLSVHYYRHRLL